LPPAGAGGIVNYAQRKHQPVSSEKRKSEIAVHGLKPKTNPKGGSTDAEKDDKGPFRLKGEVDFMHRPEVNEAVTAYGSLNWPLCSWVSMILRASS